MTPDEYVSKLARLDQLMGEDPDANSGEGQELSALADELEAYEQWAFPNLYPVQDEDMEP